jgi:hypothetical protein
MDVIIVSKTRMANNFICVGGILANSKYVRLLPSDGGNLDADSAFQIGDVYSIEFDTQRSRMKAPHLEDILVTEQSYKFSFSSKYEMIKYLVQELNIEIWRGCPETIFNGDLQWSSNGTGYISENGRIPNQSVGFWIPDRDLIRNDLNKKIKYWYLPGWKNISFVGFQEPVAKIPAGTLIRVSLARWWKSGSRESRCHLQISGWYN